MKLLEHRLSQLPGLEAQLSFLAPRIVSRKVGPNLRGADSLLSKHIWICATLSRMFEVEQAIQTEDGFRLMIVKQ